MNGILAASLCLAVLAASARAADVRPPARDFLVVYGKKELRRVGPINAKTTADDLVKLFGKAKVKNSTIVLGEDGVEQPSTEIVDGDAAATLVWETDERRDLVSVIMTERGARWHTGEGLKPGVSVRELEKINGMPFQFSGLGWDYGGLIGETKGKLSTLDGLSLVLDGEGVSDALTPFLGDRVNPMSNDPGIDKAGIRVASMTLHF